MSLIPKDLIYTDLMGDAVPVPQFTRRSDGKQVEAQGEKAPFVQLVDADGQPISSSKPFPVIQKGAIAMESWEGESDTTQTFPEGRHGFSLINDGDNDVVFTINGQTRTVKANEYYSALFDPFLVVEIKASGAYRAEVLK